MNIIYLLPFLSVNANAALIVINNGQGQQQVAQAQSDKSIICEGCTMVWDERVDGPLPAGAPVGYASRVMVKGVPSLVPDAALRAVFDQKAAEAAAAKAADDQDHSDWLAVKAKIDDGSATLPDVKQALRLLMKRFNK